MVLLIRIPVCRSSLGKNALSCRVVFQRKRRVEDDTYMYLTMECTPLELDTGIRYNEATGKG